jgi:hypothetical protein
LDFERCECHRRLSKIKNEAPKAAKSWRLFNAKNLIEALFSQSVYSPCRRISREKAVDLQRYLQEFINPPGKDAEENFSDHEVWWINYSKEHLKTVFWAELSILSAFLVAGKESCDSNIMLDELFKLFQSFLGQKTPEAMRDAIEAAKALAFELAAASGFHIFRVTESVLKRYWDHSSNNSQRPKLETIGNHATEMETNDFGDK